MVFNEAYYRKVTEMIWLHIQEALLSSFFIFCQQSGNRLCNDIASLDGLVLVSSPI